MALRLRLRTVALIGLVMLGVTDVCGDSLPSHSVSFPGHAPATSPDGRFAVVNVDNDTEPYHTIFLEDHQRKTRLKVSAYLRHVEILWNPDSRSFALTDYGGSNFSSCSIISVDGSVASTGVWEEVLKRATPEEKLMMTANDHVYIAAIEWRDLKTLKVKVWGHGEHNPDGFTRFFLFKQS